MKFNLSKNLNKTCSIQNMKTFVKVVKNLISDENLTLHEKLDILDKIIGDDFK